jgi:hypothetical protein
MLLALVIFIENKLEVGSQQSAISSQRLANGNPFQRNPLLA